MRKRLPKLGVATLLILATLTGCVALPPDALKPGPDALKERQLQTRRFDGIKESDLLAASAGVLQDMGYSVTESEAKLGLIVAAKDREAVDAGQVATAIFIAMLGGGNVAIDNDQTIRVSLVVRPAAEKQAKNHVVRVTFQRIVRNTQQQVTRIESLKEPELYEGFFDKLSKAVFLEAHKI